MKKHHKLLALLAAPVLALLFMTGCGGDDTASKSPAESKMPASDAIQEPVDVDNMEDSSEEVLDAAKENADETPDAAGDMMEKMQ